MKKTISGIWKHRGWELWVHYHPWKYYELVPPDEVEAKFYEWWNSRAPLHFFTLAQAKRLINDFMETGGSVDSTKKTTGSGGCG